MVTMKVLFTLLLLCMSSAWAYKILFVFPAATRSNDVLGKGVVWALLKAGHEVTWAATYKQESHPNLTVIDLPEAKKIVDSFDPMQMANTNNISMSFMKQHTLRICTATAQNAELRRVVVEKQFDAVVTTYYLNDYDAGYAAIQQVPWILFSTVNYHPMLEILMDEVRSIPTTPIILNECDTPMSLPRRWFNGLVYMALTVYSWYDQPNKVAQYESMFSELAAKRGVPLPPFHEAQHNVSILLVNSHESLQYGYNSPPNVINIAGYHISEHLAPLPKDLQELMDKSTNGVIFFSMGSILRATGLDPKKRDALVRMFGKLPYTVLWKYEEPLENLPPNVHVRPWLPQPTILAHKNTVAFITHGGQSSTVEAINAGMPVVVVPVGGDQPANADRAVRMGFAVKVDYYKDTLADDLEEAVKELLGDEKYRTKAKFLSKLFRTRPVPPAKLIPFYVELAIETKGAYHLRSLSLQYSWYERWMLDFVLALLGVLAALAWLVTLAVRTCVRRFSGKKKTSSKKKKQ
uniref:UDP-glucuronosyltransferase n=1 Tax=Heliothis virescens TaxID=7102 RepID=A0A2A4JVG7_HELVI